MENDKVSPLLCAVVEDRQIYYNKDAEETGIMESSDLLNEECESSASEASLNREREERNCKENN